MWYFYISSKVYNILLERLLYFLCWRAVSIHPPGSTFCFPLRSGAAGCCKWISHGYRIAKHIVIRCSRCQRITRPPFTGDVMASKRKGKELSRHTANRNEINLGQEDKISLRRKNGIWITIRNSILHFLKLDRNGKITIRTEEQKSPESHSKGSVAANILKGAAAAGLAVGGTAITQGMDVQAAEAATEMTVDTQATIATAEEAVIETGEVTAEETPAETTQSNEAVYQDTPTEVSSSEAVQASVMGQNSATPQVSETPQESETPSSQEATTDVVSNSVLEMIPGSNAQDSTSSNSQSSEAAVSAAGMEQQQESAGSYSSSASTSSSEQGLTSKTGSESAENAAESVSVGSDSISSQEHSASQEESAVTPSEAALSSNMNLTSESLSENTSAASETPSGEEEVSNSMASESASIRRHAPQRRNAAIHSVSSLDNTDNSAIAASASEAAASATRSEAADSSLSASSSQSLSVSVSESNSTAVLTSKSMSAEAVAADNTDPLEDIKKTVNSYSIYADTVNINGHMQSDLAANHLNMGNKAEIGSDNIYDKTNQKTFIGGMSKQSNTENIMPGDATNEILLSNEVYTITRGDGTTYQQPKFVYQNADGSYITSYFDSNNVEQKAPSGYIYVYQYDKTGNYTIFTMQTDACKNHNNGQNMSIRKVDYTVDIDGLLKDSNQISTNAKTHNENHPVVSMHNSGDNYTGIDATKSDNSIVYTNLDLTNKIHPWGTTDSVVSANGESQDQFSVSKGVRVNVKTDASGKASQTVVINVNYVGAVKVDYNNKETPIT